jgi:hypothetical protein
MASSSENPYARIHAMMRAANWQHRDPDRFRLERFVIDISAEWLQQAIIKARACDAPPTFRKEARR